MAYNFYWFVFGMVTKGETSVKELHVQNLIRCVKLVHIRLRRWLRQIQSTDSPKFIIHGGVSLYWNTTVFQWWTLMTGALHIHVDYFTSLKPVWSELLQCLLICFYYILIYISLWIDCLFEIRKIAVCFLWLSLPGDCRVTDEALLAETT